MWYFSALFRRFAGKCFLAVLADAIKHGFDRSIEVPAEVIKEIWRIQTEVCAPIDNGLRDSVASYRKIDITVPPILGLFAASNPFAVIRAVIAVHINPFNGEIVGIAVFVRPFGEDCEVGDPFVADFYASTSVILV